MPCTALVSQGAAGALIINIFEGGRNIQVQYPLCSPLETNPAAVDCSGCEPAGILPAKRIVSICKGAFFPKSFLSLDCEFLRNWHQLGSITHTER